MDETMELRLIAVLEANVNTLKSLNDTLKQLSKVVIANNTLHDMQSPSGSKCFDRLTQAGA